MKNVVTEAEVEQFARYNEAGLKARGGTSMPFAYHLSGARTQFALGGTMPPAAASFARNAPETTKAPPRPLPAPVAPAPPRPVVPEVPAAVVADRARMAAIVEATPPGAEAEAAEAIRTGASVEEFRRSLGAFAILSAMGARSR